MLFLRAGVTVARRNPTSAVLNSSIEITLERTPAGRDDRGPEALAVGSLGFVEKVKKELGVRAMRRQATQTDGVFTLREPGQAYRCVFGSKNDALRLKNIPFCDENVEGKGT
jgi:hypothetical protein